MQPCRLMILLLLVCSHDCQIVPEIQTSTFSEVKVAGEGQQVCAVDVEMSRPMSVRSRTQCSSCGSDCLSFNYREDKRQCDVFEETPRCFVHSYPGCRHYLKSGNGNSNRIEIIGVPGKNCSFPYTLAGSLMYACGTDKNDPQKFCPGCFIANRTWVNCSTDIDYHADYNISLGEDVIDLLDWATVMAGLPLTEQPANPPSQLLTIHGWIVIHQRLSSADTTFTQATWNDYVNGFGQADVNTAYWVGLKTLHALTASKQYALRVEMQALQSKMWYSAEYSTLSVGPSTNDYQLTVGGYTGDSGDGLANTSMPYSPNGKPFSTYDHYGSSQPAPAQNLGGWWLSGYSTTNLHADAAHYAWNTLSQSKPSIQLSASRVMIRRI